MSGGGLLESFPDVTSLLNLSTSSQTQIKDILGIFRSLGHDQAGSPIAGVTNILGELTEKLNIDVSGLTETLPSAMETLKNAIPADTIQYVESIGEAYTTVQAFLKDSELVKEVSEGGQLQDVALAVINDALTLFNNHIDGLSCGLIDTKIIEQAKGVFSKIDGFSSDFPSHREEFLPFITENLIGISPDLLKPPLEHLNASYAVFSPIEPEALNSVIGPGRKAVAEGFKKLYSAIESFDPADADRYTQIRDHLDGIETAINTLFGSLTQTYENMQQLIENHAWDTIFSVYRTSLEAVTFDKVFSLDEVVDEIAGVLEDILGRIYMLFGVEDLKERIELLSRNIKETFTGSALGQVRQTILDFLTKIRRAIESVPTENIQKTVEDMLSGVKEKLDDLNIGQVSDSIEKAFDEAEKFIIENINEALTNNIQNELKNLLGDKFSALDIDQLISNLNSALTQLKECVEKIETALSGKMDDLTNQVSQLDQLSFKPISDEVIEEIDELKARLQSINPNALSDFEKLAIKAALTVLEELDLNSMFIDALKEGYDKLEEKIKSILNELTAIIKQIKDRLDAFSPEKILKPVSDVLEQVSGYVDKLNGKVLLNPLYKQVDKFIEMMEAISPGRVLDPLQGPYDSMMGIINRLDPGQWVAPLNILYEQIDRLISLIDITPLLDELDRRQKELFNKIRGTIIKGLEDLNLPEPLSTFFDNLRPVFEIITDAIFADPENELKRINLGMKGKICLSTLFDPLDTVFNRLAGMIESIPQGALTEAMNSIRETIGVGLDQLDPRGVISRFRNGQGRFAGLAPRAMLGMTFGLPGLKLKFQAKAGAAPAELQSEAAAVSARFDQLLGIIDPEVAEGTLRQLTDLHDNLSNTLRIRINSLDMSGTGEAYARVRGNLDRLVPEFLKSPHELTHEDIITGIYSMRPSVKAAKLEQVIERFLQKIKPMEEALEPGINGFFTNLREIMMLINPITLKEAIKDIYDTLRQKVRILDPGSLADSIRENFFNPLLEPIKALNPANIKLGINEAFTKVLNAISVNVKGILDTIVNLINEQLRQIREQIRLLFTNIKDAIKMALESVKNIIGMVEEFVFVELLERLDRVIDNLGLSFDKELDRVHNAFDSMIAAIPV